VWLPEGEAPDNEPNTGSRRAPECHRRAGFRISSNRVCGSDRHAAVQTCGVPRRKPDAEKNEIEPLVPCSLARIMGWPDKRHEMRERSERFGVLLYSAFQTHFSWRDISGMTRFGKIGGYFEQGAVTTNCTATLYRR
jgi:hypothetical protein